MSISSTERRGAPSRQLDSKSVIYQSFRHSQGHPPLQPKVLSYVRAATGIEPDFALSQEEVGNYIEFLRKAPANHKHKQIDLDGRTFQAIVEEELNGVEEEWNNKADLDVRDVPAYASLVGVKILKHEIELMDNARTMRTKRDELAAPRMLRRIRSEHPSFMWRYGRDGQSTGFDVFDQMYQQAWAGFTDPQITTPATLEVIDQHAMAIARAISTYGTIDAEAAA